MKTTSRIAALTLTVLTSSAITLTIPSVASANPPTWNLGVEVGSSYPWGLVLGAHYAHAAGPRWLHLGVDLTVTANRVSFDGPPNASNNHGWAFGAVGFRSAAHIPAGPVMLSVFGAAGPALADASGYSGSPVGAYGKFGGGISYYPAMKGALNSNWASAFGLNLGGLANSIHTPGDLPVQPYLAFWMALCGGAN